MKSIFQKPVYEKEYYIKENLELQYFNRLYNYISIPTIEYYINLVEHNTIYETEYFDWILSINEKVCLENQVYTIGEIIYGINSFIYRVKECDYIENEMQKQAINDEYDKRIEELEKQKEELEKQKEENEKRKKEFEIQAKKDLEEFNKCLKSDKKWWQFWK